ncbi:hypothetical protein COV11_01975 [Candidatus Woesearchaeota archaeon CG10_big_fil_rev_8_21_14_0_10_30_7]|nr:MAG: hypothetical protein COV11_01975 [Candidatus Woesearchaeota archaeon CG10_big_fil_rev_8_21_14_0_10_30_7]
MIEKNISKLERIAEKYDSWIDKQYSELNDCSHFKRVSKSITSQLGRLIYSHEFETSGWKSIRTEFLSLLKTVRVYKKLLDINNDYAEKEFFSSNGFFPDLNEDFNFKKYVFESDKRLKISN